MIRCGMLILLLVFDKILCVTDRRLHVLLVCSRPGGSDPDPVGLSLFIIIFCFIMNKFVENRLIFF